MRFFGLGAEVMQKLGVSTSLLAGGDIFPALERGAIDALRGAAGSLIVAVFAYIAMGLPWLEHLIFTFPELLLVALALVLLAGRYTGYRLLELGRFSALSGS